MDREQFSSIVNETIGQLENSVRTLKNQQQNITLNLKELDKKRIQLSGEIADLEKEHANNIKEYSAEVDKMMKTAQDKLNNANTREAEATTKLGELNQKIKEADNLIKSNSGLQKNLKEQKTNSDAAVKKIQSLVSMIMDAVKNI